MIQASARVLLCAATWLSSSGEYTALGRSGAGGLGSERGARWIYWERMEPRIIPVGLVLVALGCTDSVPPSDSPPPDTSGDTGDTITDSGDTSGEPIVTVLSTTDQAPADECDTVCFTAQLTDADGDPIAGAPATIELQGHGFVFDGTSDASGMIEACPVPAPIGAYDVAYTFRYGDGKHRALSSATIYPFGYALGLERPLTPLATLPWVPSFTPYAGNPVLTVGAEKAWDSKDAMLPSVVHDGEQFFMMYAGSSVDNYEVGVATSDDGLAWERLSTDAPSVPASAITDDWKRVATNSPMVLMTDGQMEVWYSGRDEAASGISIGRSTTTDGVAFTDDPNNPLLTYSEANLSWEGSSVAHPTVVRRDGFVEMWYSTGLHHIGYALSADAGTTWQKYCGGPVMSGSMGTWENGQVKSSEVVFNGDQYEMTYSGGGTGSFQVGWAASSDGIRWVKHTTPVIGFGELGTWEGSGTLGAALLIEKNTYRVWYSGVSIAGSQIGYAEATR